MAILRSALVHSLKMHSIFERALRGRKRGVAMLTLAFVSLARAASADPFLITSGTFAFSFQGSAIGQISGRDFTIPGGDSNPEEFGLPGLQIEHADPFAKTLPVSGTINPNFSGKVILAKQVLPQECCLLLFDLTFSGPPAVAHSDPTLCDGCVSGTSPFQVTGELRVVSPLDDGPELFRHTIAGSGIATVGFFPPTEFEPGVFRPFARFDFSSGAATPEPGTLLLLVSGVLGATRRRRSCGVTVH